MITESDKEIIFAIIQEKTNAEIARDFCLSVRGVEQKIKKYCREYGVKGRIGIVREFLKTSI